MQLDQTMERDDQGNMTLTTKLPADLVKLIEHRSTLKGINIEDFLRSIFTVMAGVGVQREPIATFNPASRSPRYHCPHCLNAVTKERTDFNEDADGVTLAEFLRPLLNESINDYFVPLNGTPVAILALLANSERKLTVVGRKRGQNRYDPRSLEQHILPQVQTIRERMARQLTS